jgi:hypothetical protein
MGETAARRWRLTAVLLGSILMVPVVPLSIHAQPAEAAAPPAQTDCDPNATGATCDQASTEAPDFWKRLAGTAPVGVAREEVSAANALVRTTDGVKHIWTSGHSDILVPAYIWHMPWHYSDWQRSGYHKAIWGVGFSRTLAEAHDNARMLVAMGSEDSYGRFQYMAGYTWRHRWRPGGKALSLGGGYAAIVIGRADKGNYAPIPAVLPLAGIGTDRVELLGAYVPGFELAYFFVKVRLRTRLPSGPAADAAAPGPF